MKLKAAVLRLKEKAANQLASLEGGEEAGGLSEIDSQKGNGKHYHGDLGLVLWVRIRRNRMFLDLPGSVSFHHLAKIVIKTLISTVW